MGRTIGIYFDDDLLDQAQERARANGEKFSAYVQRLVAADLSNEVIAAPDPLSPTIITDLFRVLSGELDARELQEFLQSADQPRLLQSVLKKLHMDLVEGHPTLDIRGEHRKHPSPVKTPRKRTDLAG